MTSLPEPLPETTDLKFKALYNWLNRLRDHAQSCELQVSGGGKLYRTPAGTVYQAAPAPTSGGSGIKVVTIITILDDTLTCADRNGTSYVVAKPPHLRCTPFTANPVVVLPDGSHTYGYVSATERTDTSVMPGAGSTVNKSIIMYPYQTAAKAALVIFNAVNDPTYFAAYPEYLDGGDAFTLAYDAGHAAQAGVVTPYGAIAAVTVSIATDGAAFGLSAAAIATLTAVAVAGAASVSNLSMIKIAQPSGGTSLFTTVDEEPVPVTWEDLNQNARDWSTQEAACYQGASGFQQAITAAYVTSIT